MSKNHMILNLFFFNPQGDYRFSWRHPEAPEKEIYSLKYYADLAKKAEAATLDAIFIADHVAIWDKSESALEHYANTRLEPITLLSALAAVTDHIGLMATASTSYNEPFNIARSFASLDFLSNGRASWNIVTSWQEEESANFGLDNVLQHQVRYQRADEFIHIVTKLWDSWEDGAILNNKETGYFANKEKVHRLNHQGKFFKVRGPLNVPRPPQGHPILVQAGSSEAGKTLAAEHADMHFAFLKSIEDGIAYREEMNQRIAKFGRSPEHFKIIVGILPVVVDSEEEKNERQKLNESLINDQLAIDLLSQYLHTDLSIYPKNEPLPHFAEEESSNSIRTTLKFIRSFGENLTILELGRLMLQSTECWLVMGNAEYVADKMIEIYESGAADGFNLMFPLLPVDFDRFVDQVIPHLKAKGAIRQEYTSGTLREKLGFPTVKNQFTHE